VLLPEIAFALCLGVGIVLQQLGQLGIAELVAFFAMATVLRWPMESIGFLFSFLLDARTASDRIFEVFDEQNTITDPAAPVALGARAVHSRSRVCTSATRMPGRRADLLDGIDLTLVPGETMALVGLTGSGKTTLTTCPHACTTSPQGA
jgi:ATP-binding cassette subfamily B protein